MAGYNPLKITGNESGLIQSREEFLLPNDAYPILENAYVWRERIKRKQAYELLGRLQRTFTSANRGFADSESLLTISGYIVNITKAVNAVITTAYPHGLSAFGTVTLSFVQGMTQINGLSQNYTTISPTSFSVNTNSTGFTAYSSGGFFWSNDSIFTLEPNASLVPGSVTITKVAGPNIVYQDNGLGVLTSVTPGNSGTINYATGIFSLTTTAAPATLYFVTMSYTPGLPVMGIRQRALQNAINDQTVFFDTVYAYNYNSGTSAFQEFIPGTTWTGSNFEFFWTTNYWTSTAGLSIFWATNFSVSGDPLRYTDGVSWVNFAPIIDAVGNTLNQCLAMIPFRGRMVVFNTRESTGNYSNRIRWAAIGTPFSVLSTISVGVNANAWRDDIRGQGGFLDIPTSQDIISIGFVRDNLVIYCEQSTWQLRYTGRSIAPFQIEKVNSEIGSTGTFSSVQFDTSLLCVGDKGVVECDSYESRLIDIKIPDFVFKQVSHTNQGPARVHGIRDFINRLAYWTYPSSNNPEGTFPNSRLVYNYENKSWSIFTDSLTTLGTFQVPSSRTWLNTHKPLIECNFPWISTQVQGVPDIVGGNQHGFIEYLDTLTSNDPSLFISDIVGNVTTSTALTSPNHNLQTNDVISISGIPAGTPFSNLNDMVFGVSIPDLNTILLNVYDPSTDAFSLPQLDATQVYIGGGVILVRDNFKINSKKFNFIDDGENIQMGYIDILMNAPAVPQGQNPGSISLNVYLDYNDSLPINTIAENTDTFFNQTIPTSQPALNSQGGSKFWQRVVCPARSNFITLQYTFSNAQMAGIEQEYDVQIDAQIIWLRRAGRLTPF